MVSSVVAYYTGDWRWGLRIAPLLNTAAIILMVFFCGDPPRGESDFEATEGRKSDVEVKARIRPMLIRKNPYVTGKNLQTYSMDAPYPYRTRQLGRHMLRIYYT